MLKGISSNAPAVSELAPSQSNIQSSSNNDSVLCSSGGSPSDMAQPTGSSRRLGLIALGVVGLSQGASAFVPASVNSGAKTTGLPNILAPHLPRHVPTAALGAPFLGPNRAFNIVSAEQPTAGRLNGHTQLGASLSMVTSAGAEPAERSSVSAGDGSSSPKKPQNPIIWVETLEDYKQQVAGEKERLVAVKFFSPTCRACKSMAPQYKKLALKYPDVKFVEVPLTQNNAMLHQGLGVPSFPFGHLYHPEAGLVEEGSINRKRIGGFELKLSEYLAGECQLTDDNP